MLVAVAGGEARIARRVARHRLHEILNLAIEVEAVGGIELHVVAGARVPAREIDLARGPEHIDEQVVAASEEPELIGVGRSEIGCAGVRL
jgi:hypothetical protein